MAMAGATVYIAMVGGGGMDVWRWSSHLGNRVSLNGRRRTDDTWVVLRRSNRMHWEAGRATLTVSSGKRVRAREAVWVGQGSQTHAWQRVGPAAGHAAKLSDDNQTMEVAPDQEPAPLSKPVHAVFTIEKVRSHFDALMAEELPA